MGELGDARPATRQAIYILDCSGHVVAWPLRAGMGVAPKARHRHVSTFYTAEACAAGEPERDMQLASGGGLEMSGWRVREDGTRFWARVLMTAIEDNTRRALGFVLVLREVGDEAQAPSFQHISLPTKFDRRRR
jgi:hypothetical protein